MLVQRKKKKKFYIDKIAFIGRSYDEYMKMFDLDLNYLMNKKILDCAAGASSFTSEISNMGLNGIATDILYDNETDVLEKKFKNDLLKVLKAFSGVDDLYVWDYFKTPNKLRNHRIYTYQTFMNHYRKEKHSKYIKSELPKLPFKNSEFSLVLSSHFLFLYDDRLSYEFHKDSIQEMIRISKEIRIFPLVGFDGMKSSFVDKIIQFCFYNGAKVQILKVPYEFMRGGNEMMKISL